MKEAALDAEVTDLQADSAELRREVTRLKELLRANNINPNSPIQGDPLGAQ